MYKELLFMCMVMSVGPCVGMQKYANINLAGDAGHNPAEGFVIAILLSDAPAVDEFLKTGIDINRYAALGRTSSEFSPLFAAIITENASLVNKLLQKGADPNSLVQGLTNDPSLVGQAIGFINDGLQNLGLPAINFPPWLYEKRQQFYLLGSLPLLFWAVWSGNEEILKLLLDAGADTRATVADRAGNKVDFQKIGGYVPLTRTPTAVPRAAPSVAQPFVPQQSVQPAPQPLYPRLPTQPQRKPLVVPPVAPKVQSPPPQPLYPVIAAPAVPVKVPVPLPAVQVDELYDLLQQLHVLLGQVNRYIF